MTVTVADIDEWSVESIREVHRAAVARSRASRDAAQGLNALSIFETWQGETADAARDAVASTGKNLEMDAVEAHVVAVAAGQAADDLAAVKNRLQVLRQKAASMDMQIDATTNTIVPAAGVSMPLMEAELKAMELQPELTSIVAAANTVDAAFANAIEIASGDGPPVPPIPGTVPPETADLKPPPDSARGGGYWSVDRSQGGFDKPVQGPVAPWQRAIDPSDMKQLTGPSSGMQEVVEPNWPGMEAEPIAHLQEAYRLRITGQSFDGSAEHVRWIHEDGRWYQAKWVDYQFEAEHLTKVVTEQDLGGLSIPAVGLGEWEPITIQEIYNAAAHNPRLTMYIPDICGPVIAIGADESPITPGLPTASVPR
ncbi:hypothetical protein [Mycobacterium sp. MS1601]|uniref:hypothetical protein n=1 Tax=Mycobacterium sp. MS1601 TaxID=1936029 RepID=UPI0012F7C325|nr:hypothetical protein [Mycobacterium sp. MS1601]